MGCGFFFGLLIGLALFGRGPDLRLRESLGRRAALSRMGCGFFFGLLIGLVLFGRGPDLRLRESLGCRATLRRRFLGRFGRLFGRFALGALAPDGVIWRLHFERLFFVEHGHLLLES